ncbi:hypothetical protein D3C87_1879490 [compost metagenome]
MESVAFQVVIFFAVGMKLGRGLWPADLLRYGSWRCRFFLRNVSLHEEGDHIKVYFTQEAFKEFHRFELINQQRIFLFEYRILNRLFQIVHFTQMLLPFLVDE